MVAAVSRADPDSTMRTEGSSGKAPRSSSMREKAAGAAWR